MKTFLYTKQNKEYNLNVFTITTGAGAKVGTTKKSGAGLSSATLIKRKLILQYCLCIMYVFTHLVIFKSALGDDKSVKCLR